GDLAQVRGEGAGDTHRGEVGAEVLLVHETAFLDEIQKLVGGAGDWHGNDSEEPDPRPSYKATVHGSQVTGVQSEQRPASFGHCGCKGARGMSKRHRGVGPPHARDLGLRAEVDCTEASKSATPRRGFWPSTTTLPSVR